MLINIMKYVGEKCPEIHHQTKDRYFIGRKLCIIDFYMIFVLSILVRTYEHDF